MSEAAAQRLEDQLQALSASRPASTTLTIQEQELTSWVAPYLQNSPLSDLTIWIEPPQIMLQAHADWRGQHDLRARISINVAADRLLLHLDALSLDGHALPRWLRASIDQAANDALRDASLSLVVQEIVLQQGVAFLSVRH